jgi:predicted permease
VRAVLMEPLRGIPRSHELVVVQALDARDENLSFSYPDAVDYQATPGVGFFVQEELALSLAADERADRIWGLVVTENYFEVLGVQAAKGRALNSADGRTPGAGAVVVISDGLWRRRFAADPGIVGRTVTLNRHPFTIVGVAPPEFRGTVVGLAFDAYVPVTMSRELYGVDRLGQRGNHWLQGMARLGPGVSLSAAQAAFDATARRLAETHPEDKDTKVRLHTFWNSPIAATAVLGPVLKVLFAVVGVVLLIACANVANLLLAKATSRRREVAVRLALGASRGRLVRQMLTESVVLALLGAAAGGVLSLWSSGLLSAFAPPTDLPIVLTPAMDLRAFGFALALGTLTALVFGTMPALQATRPAVTPTLRNEQTTVVGGRSRLRGALVAAQVCLSLVLLVSAGLLVRSLRAAITLDPGFQPKGALLASVDLFASGYTKDTGRQFHATALERISALPGVTVASLTRRAPLGFGGSSSSSIQVEGYTPPDDKPTMAYYHVVGPRFFQAIGGRIARGREFDVTDTLGGPSVVVVDETMARRYWGDRDPVGGRVRIFGEWRTVVGVSRPMKHRSLTERPGPHVFLPVFQLYFPQVSYLVRTDGDPQALASAVTTQLRAIDPSVPVFSVFTLKDHVQASRFQQRMAVWLLGVFGAVAVALAAVGLHGVLAYAVGQRTREIGIRIALGSDRRRIFALVARHGLGMVAVGVVLGLVAAAGVTRLMAGLLIGVSPTDTLTFAAVSALLAAVALLACALPARRATRVDPVAALRHD